MKHLHLILFTAFALTAGCKKPDAQPAAPPAAVEAPPAAIQAAAREKPAPPSTPPKLDGPTAPEILAKVAEAYLALTNYSASGKTVSEVDMSSMDFSKMPGLPAGAAESPEMKQAVAGKQTTVHAFTLKLDRAGRYVIEWELSAAAMPGMAVGKGAVWSDGSSHFLMMSPDQYSKLRDRMMALGSATGISGGAAHTVPSVFYGLQTLNLEQAARWHDEKVDGEDCYLVDGSMGGMLKMRYWIRKQDHLIKQRQQVMDGTGNKPPAMTEAQLHESLKAAGQEPTAEGLAQMRKTMEGTMAMAAKMKATMTETHSDIRINQPLKITDLVFKRPSTAKLGPSPLDQFMKPQPQ